MAKSSPIGCARERLAVNDSSRSPLRNAALRESLALSSSNQDSSCPLRGCVSVSSSANTRSCGGSPLRAEKDAADGAVSDANSASAAAATATVKVATSLSVTGSVSLPLVKPVADAVIVTVCIPSTIVSSTAASFTVTEELRARIVAVADTVASLDSLLARVTVNAEVVSVLRVIVTVVAAAPAVSATEAAATSTVKAGAGNEKE